ncbi:L-threonylcarbamoyladenylate synthase [Plebeiibacterium marinum]|uniref:L-threonylcarbamoyladenylate synthase n=1 Tax=Plebeiibacterium marinum TaxID=2992111 RepID=A0AAE3MD50_9BACT|nr:L-threonylcarbamoyladenylate synthase [Plebeiobacterium marinum]MCW3805246.1 L-threonylcarbamoyladenylate synthase [Plebeiobacterium marinum]
MHDDIKKAIEVLQQGGLILYPTDTIWGIGCDATNPEAVKRVYELKQREDSKSMLVLLDNDAKLNSYMDEVPEMAWDIVELATKPTTIIYPNAKNLAANLLAEDKSVGIRITKEEFSHKLCQRFKKPIVSTSANISGQPSPANFGEISEEVKNGVDYIIEYRQEETSNPAPSSIIKLGLGGEIQIIRE